MLGPMRGLRAARERRQRTGERLQAALEHTSSNREELSRSDIAGCVYCLQLFNPQEEELEYGERGGPDDASCPRCDEPMVIGSGSGYPITLEFMAELNEYKLPGMHSPFDWVLLGTLIAVALGAVLAVVLAVVYLSLPWGRILIGFIGLGVVALGVEAILKQRIEQAKIERIGLYEGTSGEPVEGFWAVFGGIAFVLTGIGFLASVVFAPWE